MSPLEFAKSEMDKPEMDKSDTIAYLDCPTGISGDMCLGALVSAGVPLDYFVEILARMGLAESVHLSAETVYRNGQAATRFHVDGREATPTHRHFPEIAHLIQQANLPPRVAQWSLDTFRQLAIAEGKVHGIPPESVHFHEVGALDAIADITCTCAGLDWLGISEVFCSALPTGGGYVWCEHGQLPVPTPAVMQLWQMHRVPVYSNGIAGELVTPTGAALAVTLCERFGPPPSMTVQLVGLGAGMQDLSLPNILRLWIGDRYDVANHGIKKKPVPHHHA